MLIPVNMYWPLPVQFLNSVPGGLDADKLALLREFMGRTFIAAGS